MYFSWLFQKVSLTFFTTIKVPFLATYFYSLFTISVLLLPPSCLLPPQSEIFSQHSLKSGTKWKLSHTDCHHYGVAMSYFSVMMCLMMMMMMMRRRMMMRMMMIVGTAQNEDTVIERSQNWSLDCSELFPNFLNLKHSLITTYLHKMTIPDDFFFKFLFKMEQMRIIMIRVISFWIFFFKFHFKNWEEELSVRVCLDISHDSSSQLIGKIGCRSQWRWWQQWGSWSLLW